ncbi:hypothetical protein F5148DRAFT_973186 [Russula earlei]|uniref:Uncharacterized protein n=1 Tax=Russula earlei TaxID=71964 RepID=A0ACC0UMT0_9AGAM|nr:hypothetical protein F5148DRAFT_973186 [Russula earlei]
MPSQTFGIPSGAPSIGFFPNGPSAPHAFATMHSSPRDQHSMYASLGTSYQIKKSNQSGTGGASKASGKK